MATEMDALSVKVNNALDEVQRLKTQVAELQTALSEVRNQVKVHGQALEPAPQEGRVLPPILPRRWLCKMMKSLSDRLHHVENKVLTPPQTPELEPSEPSNKRKRGDNDDKDEAEEYIEPMWKHHHRS